MINGMVISLSESARGVPKPPVGSNEYGRFSGKAPSSRPMHKSAFSMALMYSGDIQPWICPAVSTQPR